MLMSDTMRIEELEQQIKELRKMVERNLELIRDLELAETDAGRRKGLDELAKENEVLRMRVDRNKSNLESSIKQNDFDFGIDRNRITELEDKAEKLLKVTGERKKMCWEKSNIQSDRFTRIEKRLDELERKEDAHIEWHHEQYDVPPPAPPPERPEPVVCGNNCKHLTSDGHCGLAPIPTTMQCFFTSHDCPEWEEKEPATQLECLCDARRREEEAGMFWFKGAAFFFTVDRRVEMLEECIHCNLPIKRSLLGE